METHVEHAGVCGLTVGVHVTAERIGDGGVETDGVPNITCVNGTPVTIVALLIVGAAIRLQLMYAHAGRIAGIDRAFIAIVTHGIGITFLAGIIDAEPVMRAL